MCYFTGSNFFPSKAFYSFKTNIAKNLWFAAHFQIRIIWVSTLSLSQRRVFIFSFPPRDSVKRDFKLLAFEGIGTISRDFSDILGFSPISLSRQKQGFWMALGQNWSIEDYILCLRLAILSKPLIFHGLRFFIETLWFAEKPWDILSVLNMRYPSNQWKSPEHMANRKQTFKKSWNKFQQHGLTKCYGNRSDLM